ncbi:hypothetical protein ACHAPO_010891 [Fusarium lateritium]
MVQKIATTAGAEDYDEKLKEVIRVSREWMRYGYVYTKFRDFGDDIRRDIRAGVYGDLPEFPPPDKVKKEAKEHSESIFSYYNLLNQILERHEATIQKRWTKKTRQQRIQILLKAWPNMPEQHRPDWAAFEREQAPERISKRGSQYKDWFMWPQINQEDLLQPKMMLLLLNARGRNIPPVFAAADWSAMHVGQFTQGLSPPFIDQFTMVLNGATTPEQYGEMLSWSKDNWNQSSIYAGWEYWPGEGILILRAQVRIMNFLVDYCRQTLHEIPPDDLTSSVYPAQPEPSLKTGIDEFGYSSMAVMAAEASYKVPSDIDWVRISSLLGAQLSATEDHIWSLREDPEYFKEVLLEQKDHCPESMLDSDGKAHILARKGMEDKLWGVLLCHTAALSYSSLEVMTELHRQARDLGAIQKKCKDEIKMDHDLPREYCNALYFFRSFLNTATSGPVAMLKEEFQCSLPMRRHYVRNPGQKTISRIQREDFHDELERLIFIIDHLNDDAEQFEMQTILIDELDRLLKNTPRLDRLISAKVYKTLSYLSVLSQCRKQIELYQPWARMYDNTKRYGGYDSVSFQEECAAVVQSVAEIIIRMGDVPGDSFGRAADPSGGRFKYPYEKRRTWETVYALRKAEANLDAVWAEFGRLTNLKDYKDLVVYRLLSQRSLRRTADWVEPEKTKNNGQPSIDKDLRFIHRPLSNLFLGESEQPKIDKTVKTIKAKTKTKTKGEPSKAQNGDTPAAEVPEPETVDEQPTFQVDARALKVFRTLFYNPEVTSTPGEIPWNDFLHAMGSTGFQIEKLYGSVWQFQPTNLDVERGIHFHEPHPKGKISFEIARRQGRRLARTYGWHGGMFILKKK